MAIAEVMWRKRLRKGGVVGHFNARHNAFSPKAALLRRLFENHYRAAGYLKVGKDEQATAN